MSVIQSMHRSNRAERCPYRTRLEDRESSQEHGADDFRGSEDILFAAYPPRDDAIMAGQHPDTDFLIGSSTTLPDMDEGREVDAARRRASVGSWTKV